LAGNQPVYNTKHLISLPQFWNCLREIWHAIAMPSLVGWNQLYAITALGSMSSKYLCSHIQICHFV